MDLQKLFIEPILEIKELTRGDTGHASDIWLVRIKKGEFVVRSSRLNNESNNDFWWGCNHLFGIDPRKVFDLEILNHTLNKLSHIPVPKVISAGIIDNREYLIVEKMEGSTLESFHNQSDNMLEQLGQGIAKIHSHSFDYFGNPAGTFKCNLTDFNKHLADTIKEVVDRFYLNNEEIKNKFNEILPMINELTTPNTASLVLVDMDPTQFLYYGDKITALVDTEAYVVAPRELDFIALEYVLDRKGMEAFIRGYESVLDIPDLSKVRLVYRFLYRLFSIQGSVDIDKWMEHPVKFHAPKITG